MEDYYTIQTPGHHTAVFKELHALQKQGVLCDVILAAEDGEVMAHKVVLMAASKYFREKLSPLVSVTPSRICLKGISVVELANLVKYIYTGKLLVAKETMDVTLEVSEILELKGVTQGYNDIVTYEQMKTDGDIRPPSSNSDEVQELVITQHDDASDNVTNVSKEVTSANSVAITCPTSSTQTQSVVNTTSVPAVQSSDEAVQSQDIRVTEFCEDGSTITYSLDQSAVSTSQNSNEYAFEFNPYDQQYMDVEVGANAQVSPSAKMPGLQKMVASNQSITDEQAQHQDLLAVAIETLSDQSHFISGIPKATSTTPIGEVQEPGNLEAPEVPAEDIASTNGRVESKIVTLNAGTVSNELGGQTSVYTVALDPSSIKKPLIMPRAMRKKTEKEKQAEKAAKMYRKKKAELLNRQTMIKPLNQSDPLRTLIQASATHEAAVSPVKERRMPRILLKSASPKRKAQHPDKLQHVLIHRSQDGSVTTTKVSGSGSEEQTHAELLNKEEFGQVVNFDSDTDEEDTMIDVLGVEEHISEKKNLDAEKENKLKGKMVSIVTASKSNDKRTAEESHDKDVERRRQEMISADKIEGKNVSGSAVESADEQGNTRDKPGRVGTRNIFKAVEEIEKSKANVSNVSQSTDTSTIDAPLDQVIQKNVQQSFDNTVNTKYKHIKAALASKQKEDKSKAVAEINVTITSPKNSNCGDHEQFSLVENDLRSSATKRKGKVPRRLPMTAAEEAQNSKKNGQDIVRTKKNSRTEKNENNSKSGRVTRSRSMNANDIGIDGGYSKDSLEIKKMDKANKITTEGCTETTPVNAEENTTGEIINSEAMTMGKISCQPTVKLERLSEAQIEKETSVSVNKKNSSESEIQIESVHGNASNDWLSKVSGQDVDAEPAGNSKETEFDQNDKGSEEITLEMTVDSVLDMDNETEPGKRKLDDDTVELPVKRIKRTRSSTAARKSDDEKLNPSESHDKPPEVKVIKNFSPKPAVKIKTEPEETPQIKAYCDVCDLTFKAEFDLHIHYAQVHDKPLPRTSASYSCPVCKEVAVTFKVIDSHTVSKHEGLHVPCVYCEKMFKTYSEMKKHLIAHGEKRHKCPHCNYVSQISSCINVHMMLKHSSAKEESKCIFCAYKTALKGNMRKHILTAHELIVVTKQSLENREKYRDIDEGSLVTLDGQIFNPETMKVPKMSSRRYLDKTASNKDKRLTETKTEASDDETEIGQGKVQKHLYTRRAKNALRNLPTEEFTKEVLKRHEEFLKKPEKPLKFMSHSLAVATEQPSFPQASPSVRQTKADKIYYTKKPPVRFQDLSHAETQQYVAVGTSSVPTVDNEIEVVHNESPVTVVTENVESEDQTEHMIVVMKDGEETVMHPKDFYNALVEKENSAETRETIGVINALLAAGQEVQIQEREVNQIEIQNA